MKDEKKKRKGKEKLRVFFFGGLPALSLKRNEPMTVLICFSPSFCFLSSFAAFFVVSDFTAHFY
jgi:hypothetical protein